MTTHTDFPEIQQINALARAALTLGHEILDIAGSFDLDDAQARSTQGPHFATDGQSRG